MWFTPKMKLSCLDQLNWVWSMTKTRQNNDVKDFKGAIYDEKETELSRPIKSGAVYDEN